MATTAEGLTMRGWFIQGMLCLLAAVFVAATDADAAQRTSTRRSKGDKAARERSYALEDVMKAPKEYLEREVVFYCRYAANANLFKPVSTRFNVTQHLNFAVWPDKAVLWEEKSRKNILPTLYIAKNDPVTMDVLRGAKRYELLAVTGTVLNVYAGYPWILVTKIERVEKPSERLSEIVIEHMQSGYEALRANAGGVAARHFEQAIQFGLPCEYRAKAYEQLAQAYLLDDQLDRARGYLRQAVQVDKADPILHLALADVTLRMGDPGEAIAHATFALERSGRYPQAYGIKGEALSLLGDYGKAFADLNTAAGTPGITAREKAMVNIRRARIYTRSDRYPDAARVYASSSEPGEPLAGEAWLHNEIGLFYERLFLESSDARYLDSAYTAFNEGAVIGSLDPDVLYNMTEVEFRRQRLSATPDFAKVAELIERIYQIEPDYTPARILEGRLLYQQGKLEEAEARYQSVTTQIGSDPMALLALAEAYLDLGRDKDAATVAARARALQPWNHRVQALGKLIEENAAAIAADRAEKTAVVPASMESVIMPDDPEWGSAIGAVAGEGEVIWGSVATETPAIVAAAPEMTAPEIIAPDISAFDVSSDRPSVIIPGESMWESASPEVPAEVAMPNAPAGRPSVVAPGDPMWEYVTIEPIDAMQPVPGTESAPEAPASVQPQPENTPKGNAPGTRRTRVKRHRLAEVDAMTRDGENPQEIQASIHPQTQEDAGRVRYPVTEVYLPDNWKAEQWQPRESTESIVPAPAATENNDGPGRLDLGFTPGRTDKLPAVSAPDADRYDDNFGREYIWPDDAYGEGDAERYGMIEGVGSAYASLPLPDMVLPGPVEADGTHIPRTFSFEPDESPVILAGVSSPGDDGRPMPARNANIYRPFHGGRQMAEIIEREPVNPRPGLNGTPAMVPPAGGVVRRAEVRLPSSSRGVDVRE